MVELLFPPEGYVFDAHTQIQNTFIHKIHTQDTERAWEWLAPLRTEDCSAPRALQLAWQGGAAPWRVELAASADFADAYTQTVDRPFLDIYNLKLGTIYYWRVNGGPARYFTTTENTPRFLRLEGAMNVRDLGGSKIKQGILFRGTDLDGPHYLTEAGKDVFKNELKIKTEMELRKGRYPEQTQSTVPGVERIYAPYRPYMEVFEEEHRQAICKIMDIFADESKYPIYFHCEGGADRTGMLAIYLRAIAEECEDDIHTDYELTALSTYAAGRAEGAVGFRSRNAVFYREFLDELKKYAPGQPLWACIQAFLMNCGVSAEQIAKIRSIIQK